MLLSQKAEVGRGYLELDYVCSRSDCKGGRVYDPYQGRTVLCPECKGKIGDIVQVQENFMEYYNLPKLPLVNNGNMLDSYRARDESSESFDEALRELLLSYLQGDRLKENVLINVGLGGSDVQLLYTLYIQMAVRGYLLAPQLMMYEWAGLKHITYNPGDREYAGRFNSNLKSWSMDDYRNADMVVVHLGAYYITEMALKELIDLMEYRNMAGKGLVMISRSKNVDKLGAWVNSSLGGGTTDSKYRKLVVIDKEEEEKERKKVRCITQ